jgi:hypothetical protein
MISTSQTSLIIGAGADLSYVETLALYYFDQEPAFAQSLRTKRNGGIVGSRVFAAWNIPYIESLSFQFRVGYTSRPQKKIPGETEELLINNSGREQEKMDPAFFESFDTYSLSQYLVTFSVAYLF